MCLVLQTKRLVDELNHTTYERKFQGVTNESLDSTVSTVLHNFPNCGIRRMKGFLLG